MAGPDPRYPVSDTAALVMLWAGSYYANNPLIGPYLRRLDLSSGKALVERYNAICPWYSEVIVNRKHFIRSMAETLAGSDDRPVLIVNLGAGFSPLALELSPLLSDRVHFVEMDLCNMEKKAVLYAGLIPDRCGCVTCIPADIGDTAALSVSLSPLLTDKTRLIVVMEGLSYYIKKPVMEQVIGCMAGLTPETHFIFEHLKPCRLVGDDRRSIPYGIFSHVRDYTGMDRMTTYSADEIRTMFGNRFSCRYYDMDEMELNRTGAHRYFPRPDSGWLSCAVVTGREGMHGNRD